jgi:hypothetical protein
MHKRDYATTSRSVIEVVMGIMQAVSGNEREIRKALHAAYPFPKRYGHAYRVWLREVRSRCAREGIPWRKRSAPREQLTLFRI